MAEEIYKSAKELAGLPGMPGSVQGVIDRAKRGNWNSQTRTGKGGGKEYPISVLPEATRTFLSLQAGKDQAVELYGNLLPKLSPELQASVDKAHAEMPVKPEFFIDWAHFRRKTAKVQGKAFDQAAVVVQLKKMIDLDRKAVFALRQAQGERLSGDHCEDDRAMVAAGRLKSPPQKATPLNTLMQRVAAANPEVCSSWRTLQNWWLGKPGKPGCINFDVNDYAPALSGCYTGRTALAECTQAAFDYYWQLYLHRSQPSHKDCYRRTVEMGVESAWSIPSMVTLQRRLEAENSLELITYMREGAEALRLLSPFQFRDTPGG